MHDSLPPRLLRAACVSARALGVGRIHTVAILPVVVAGLAPIVARGGLYMDSSGTGIVTIYRRRPFLDTVGTILCVAAVVGVPLFGVGTIVAVLTSSLMLGMLFVCLLVAAVALPVVVEPLADMLRRPGRGADPRVPIPTGERWIVANLAQMPHTRATAALLAYRLHTSLPPDGAVIVARAKNDK